MQSTPARRRSLILAASLLVLAALDATVVEPGRLVTRTVRVAAPGPPLRIALLADLHLRRFEGRERRLAARVASLAPDAIAVAGDLIANTPRHDERGVHIAAAARLIAELRRTAPVYLVQGHSDYDGRISGALARAGGHWLGNDSVTLRAAPWRLDLAGLDQQAGEDLGNAYRVFGVRRTGVAHAAVWAPPLPNRNFYATCCGGAAAAWRDYEVTVAMMVTDPAAGIGVGVYSGAAEGRDRMYRLRRAGGFTPGEEYFGLVAQGTELDGGPAITGIVPRPGVWYRLRLRVRTFPERTELAARIWPAGGSEPREWTLETADTSPERLRSGAVSLWGWGAGEHYWSGMRVARLDGGALLAALSETAAPSASMPPGWIEGSRDTRLALALSRRPPGEPRATIVLAHSPDVVAEVCARGLPLLLAGHTHGGQVRLPFFGALTTRSRLGRHIDRGLFAVRCGSAHRSRLVINAGFGTSLAPVRFFCPPEVTLVEWGGGS